jgi:hypothetical protein
MFSGTVLPRIYNLIVARIWYEKVRNSLWHRFGLEKTSLWGDFFFLEARHIHCTIPRDRTFALLALLKESEQIAVDYQILAFELAFHLLKLQKGTPPLPQVLKLMYLIRDEGIVYNETIGAAGHFIEFRVFFTGIESRPTKLQDDSGLYVVDRLLEKKSLGHDAAIHGRGFKMIRSDGDSRMLHVRVALSTLSDLLDSLDPWSLPYLHVIENPRFDMNFGFTGFTITFSVKRTGEHRGNGLL